MDETIVTAAISWLSIAAVGVAVIKFSTSGDRLSTFLAAALFIPSPLWIGDSLHKLVFAADVVAVVYLVRRFISQQRGTLYPELTLVRGRNYLLLLFLVVIPITSTLLQFIFSESTQIVHTVIGILRMIGGVWIFANIYSDVLAGRTGWVSVVNFAMIGYLFYSAGALLSFAGIIETDTLRYFGDTSGFHEWNEGLGAGVMGLFRGEVGGVAAFAVALSLPVVLQRVRSIPVAWLIVAVSFVVAASVGSRQGMLAIGTVVLFQWFLVYLQKDYILLIRYGISLVAISIVLGIYLLNAPALVEWLLTRFESILVLDEGLQAVALRDERMWEIVDKQLSNLPILVFGSGVGNVSEFLVSDLWMMTYVDSDLVWGLQQVGLIGLAAYILFLSETGIQLWSLRQRIATIDFISQFGGMLVIASFLYGHYVLMNWQAAHFSAAVQILALIAFIRAQFDCVVYQMAAVPGGR